MRIIQDLQQSLCVIHCFDENPENPGMTVSWATPYHSPQVIKVSGGSYKSTSSGNFACFFACANISQNGKTDDGSNVLF